MSTRANLIIKNKHDFVQLYHHHDGYPDGMGKDLQDYFKGMLDVLSKTPMDVANYLCDDERNDEYMLEDNYEFAPNPHGDIEYLYVLDLDLQKVRCYKVNMYPSDDVYEHLNEILDGKYQSNDCRFIYESTYFNSWCDVENEYPIVK